MMSSRHEVVGALLLEPHRVTAIPVVGVVGTPYLAPGTPITVARRVLGSLDFSYLDDGSTDLLTRRFHLPASMRGGGIRSVELLCSAGYAACYVEEAERFCDRHLVAGGPMVGSFMDDGPRWFMRTSAQPGAASAPH